MIGPFRRRTRRDAAPPDPQALFADLAAARQGTSWTDRERRRDFRTVFLGSPAGRRVLYEILAWSRVFASTFVPGDAHATHWREGGRDVGLRILALLEADRTPPDATATESLDHGAERGVRP